MKGNTLKYLRNEKEICEDRSVVGNKSRLQRMMEEEND